MPDVMGVYALAVYSCPSQEQELLHALQGDLRPRWDSLKKQHDRGWDSLRNNGMLPQYVRDMVSAGDCSTLQQGVSLAYV